MVLKDRERLALSTGIALAGYGLLFVLLMGLNLPSSSNPKGISAPLSVYVNLQGTEQSGSPSLRTATPSTKVPAAAQSATPANTPQQAPTKALTLAAPRPTQPTPTQSAPTTTPAATPTPTSSQDQTTGSAQSQGTAQGTSSAQSSAASPPSRPARQPGRSGVVIAQSPFGNPSSTNSTSQSQSSTITGGLPQSQSSVSGPRAATPGVNYPPGADVGPTPPQGGGTGSQIAPGQSQTFYGPPASSSGSFLSSPGSSTSGLSGSGNGGSSAGSNSGQQASGTAGSAAAGGGSSGGAPGASGSAGQAASSPSASTPAQTPRIKWEGSSTSRAVASEPDALVIPKRFLNEIPPTITLKIAFQVSPLGTVSALNVTPSLGYPELDNVLEAWMEKWRFQPISGNQVAQGTLEYVIQADTAK